MTPEERAALVEKVARLINPDWDMVYGDKPFFHQWRDKKQQKAIKRASEIIDLLTPIIRAEALVEAAETGFHAAREWVGEDLKGSLYDDTTAQTVRDAILALIHNPQKTAILTTPKGVVSETP